MVLVGLSLLFQMFSSKDHGSLRRLLPRSLGCRRKQKKTFAKSLGAVRGRILKKHRAVFFRQMGLVLVAWVSVWGPCFFFLFVGFLGLGRLGEFVGAPRRFAWMVRRPLRGRDSRSVDIVSFFWEDGQILRGAVIIWLSFVSLLMLLSFLVHFFE